MQSKIVRTGVFVLAAAAVVAAAALGAFRVGPLPVLEVKPQLPVIGRRTPVASGMRPCASWRRRT